MPRVPSRRSATLAPVKSLGGRRVQYNPSPLEEAAAQLSAAWHGRPAKETMEVEETVVLHDVLPHLAWLEALEVLVSDDKAVTIEFKRDVALCGTLGENQLYFVGGDQRLSSLDPFRLDEGEAAKDLVNLGPCFSIRYYTDKYHLQGTNGFHSFIHHFGDKGGVLPVLVYDVLNKRLMLVGGSYTITDAGIDN